MNKTHQFNIWYFVIAFIAIGMFQAWWVSEQQTRTVSYSEFIRLLEAGQIREAVVTENFLRAELVSADTGAPFIETRLVDPSVVALLASHDVTISGATENTFLATLLSWVFPVLFFVGIWMFAFRRLAQRQGFGGLTNIGKSGAKVYVETDTGVTFDDVAGVDEAKAELQEVVTFLKDQSVYGRLGAHIPKGILLQGPPGTGKTLLARAVAGEAGVPFYSISGSEFVEMFVGVGAARVRDLFDQARKAAPCIIFIDELDSLGRMRGVSGYSGGHDEKEQTLNQLLAELDGFDPIDGIVLLAATNRPEILDPALMRAGRFDRHVMVDRPDKIGREAILRVHMRKITADADADASTIAGLTPGLTGADLANLVNEAAIAAVRRGGETVTLADFTEAVERIVAGSERRSRVMNQEEREIVAFHEMGHALVAAALPGSDPVHKVSIIPRSIGALGYTLQRPTEDRFLIAEKSLLDRLSILMAGRAAEELMVGGISTGAADDLDKASDIARQIVMRFGMSPALGQVVYDPPRGAVLGGGDIGLNSQNFSPETGREIDLAVRDLINDAYQNAQAILAARRDDLAKGARLLLERETLTPDDFAPIASGARSVSPSDPVV